LCVLPVSRTCRRRRLHAARSVLLPLAGAKAPRGLVVGLTAVTRALELHELQSVLVCQARHGRAQRVANAALVCTRSPALLPLPELMVAAAR
jgi:hypothetical protein